MRELVPCVILLFAVIVTAQDMGPKAPANGDYEWASPDAVARWHDLKFGLRIHWGAYAIDGIGPESWPLSNLEGKNQTFLKEYWDRPKTWNPKNWNPDAWIALMKRGGIKFFDFTTKHHEGFSMYDTSTKASRLSPPISILF